MLAAAEARFLYLVTYRFGLTELAARAEWLWAMIEAQHECNYWQYYRDSTFADPGDYGTWEDRLTSEQQAAWWTLLDSPTFWRE